METPTFKTRKELYTWLKENKEDIIYSKKSQFKKADGFGAPCTYMQEISAISTKDLTVSEPDSIKVRAIINTTMIMDSHKDVHINGIWNKTIKENKRIKHIQEHEMKFDKIISDKEDLDIYVKQYTWRDLGYDVEGKTEALVFDSVVKRKRNAFMYEQYKQNNVDNHSVGMYYVTIKMAFNSSLEEDSEYKEVWDEHIDDIANKEEVEKNGYFYAVYEAKAIEGSAVAVGSNPITPTVPLSKTTKETKDIIEIKKWLGIADN
jgi:hypothetical protein